MLITLIVLMVFVLTGLILVQTKMIKTASDIREEQFNQLVKNATVAIKLIPDELQICPANILSSLDFAFSGSPE